MFAKFPGSSPVDLGRGATPNSSPPLTNRSEEKEGTKPRLDPPRRPEQSNGDTDTVQCGPNTMDLLGGFSCTGGRRKATTDSSLEEAMSPSRRKSRETEFKEQFPGDYFNVKADFDSSPPTTASPHGEGADSGGELPGTSPSERSESCSPQGRGVQRGDKLRKQVGLVPPISPAGQLEKLRQRPESEEEARSETDRKPPEGRGAEAATVEALPALNSGATSPEERSPEVAAREVDRTRSMSSISGKSTAELRSPRRVNQNVLRLNATQLNQLMQVPGQPPGPPMLCQEQLAMKGDNLDLVMAPGDVLLIRGSGQISNIGNAGGFMGHVLVVTAQPVAVQANTPQMQQLMSIWPDEARTLWRVQTVESKSSETGLYECESLLYVQAHSRTLLLIGEVETSKEGDVCSFEPHEPAEIWQMPVFFRETMRPDLMDCVLNEMRKHQASWSRITAWRAAVSKVALQGAGISLHRTHFETLQEIKSYWEKDPICTSIVITFWQRYLEKLAGTMGVGLPDLRPEARFAVGQDVSFWNSSRGSWEKARVAEQVIENGQLVAYHLNVKRGVSPHEVRRRFDDEWVSKKVVDLIQQVVPLKADRALPGDLTKTMKLCGWCCIAQVPVMFRPFVKITPQMVVPVNQPPSPQLPAPGPMQPQISGPPLQLPSPNGTPPNGPQPQPGAPPSSNGGSISASPPGSLPPTPATPNGAPGIFGQARSQSPTQPRGSASLPKVQPFFAMPGPPGSGPVGGPVMAPVYRAPPSSSAPGREPRSSPMSSAEVDAPLPRPISQQSMPRISTPEVTPEGKLDLVRKRESHKDLGSSEASDRAAESEGSLHDPCIDDAGLGEGL
ncbi:unnamed protein product [Durusdinium trenchii]|uniref:Uncharacterized protein n=1 Tax=Durusdinium trenchii TaxID=1381693 RepID=A0ABP0NKD8_9DINO